MVKLKMTAVVPVVQYGNIQPSIELEGEDYKELEIEAMKHIKTLWNRYAEKPFPEDKTSKGNQEDWKKFITFTDEVVWYNDKLHQYIDEKGNPLISGSKYAHKDEKPFDPTFPAKKLSDIHGCTPEDIKAVWEENGNVSKDFGTIIHKAMQFWFDHKKATCGEKEYNTPNHPILKNVVESFPDKDVNGMAEIMVSDVAEGRVGQIDLLEILPGDQVANIIDYKTDAPAKIAGNLENYWVQLNYYANILIAHGWTIPMLKIWHLGGSGWVLYEKEPWILDEDISESESYSLSLAYNQCEK
jgi:hypothetical protein